ncbi:hypothetical protein H8695_05265 [Clostridiales bacterium BX7]|uniref:Uncharacterized protein n=2 Tax=Feifania hominis TaxID=2763660 RepID=A0A926DF11_9FIRM|nr:hypothetical protein [Feifania hominis]
MRNVVMTMTNSEPQGLRCPFEDPDGPPPDLTRDQLESAYARMKSGLEQTQDPRRRFALCMSLCCCCDKLGDFEKAYYYNQCAKQLRPEDVDVRFNESYLLGRIRGEIIRRQRSLER